MNENILRRALIETGEEMILNEYSDCEDIIFTLTKAFNKKAEKLCKGYDKVTFKLTYTRVRKVICVFVAILILMLSTLSVGAVRDALANFFIKHFSNHAVITYKDIDNNPKEYPKTIETKYDIDPSLGYKLDDGFELDTWICKSYSKGEYVIMFEQFAKDEYGESTDNEQTVFTYETINGQDYLIRKIHKQYVVTWDSGEYIFQILSNLDKDSIIWICENLKIKK